MENLTRRVQVLFSPQQLQQLKRMAQARGESVAELIRQAVEQAYFAKQRQRGEDAVRRMASMDLPVADWEQMERESAEG